MRCIGRNVWLVGLLLWIAWIPQPVWDQAAAEEEDYVAKKGLELYEKDLHSLVQQILALGPSDRGQQEFLDRMFQLKYGEVEKLFDLMGQGDPVKRRIAELCVVKAVENHALGNWIQAYFALKDAEGWNPTIRAQSVRIAGKPFEVASFAKELEESMLDRGANVRFLIRPFPEDRLFRPDKVALVRTELERKHPLGPARPERRVASVETDVSSTLGAPGGRAKDSVGLSDKDRDFLSERLRKALYKYFYEPTERNSEFTLYLPSGTYAIGDSEFAIHPVQFEVRDEDTQVVLQPARWFRLSFSGEVHPSEISVLYRGEPWTDLAHVPFGKYRIEVRNKDYTYPLVKVSFVPKEKEAGMENVAASREQEPEGRIVVEDRGNCKLVLKPRDGNEKFRYSLLGY